MGDQLRRRRSTGNSDRLAGAVVVLPSLALLILVSGGKGAWGQQSLLTGPQPFSGAVSPADLPPGEASRPLAAFPNPFGVSLGAVFRNAPAKADQLFGNPIPGSELPLPPDQTPPCGALSEGRPVSWKLLVPNALEDQKKIWLFPAQVVRGKHWKPALGFVAASAGLIALDPSEAPYFRSTSSYHTFNQAFSSSNTGIGMAAMPVTFYAVALVRHNTYDEHTSLLAGEAVLDSELLATVMKSTIRRLRPAGVPPNGNFWDTFTDAKGGLFSGAGSFPSGHSIAAFSIATIFANRYSRHRWVPWVAYGLAASIAFSRVTLQAHFTSDVFAGAVLGYTISHYVVLRP